jgi:membrane associated rhomboid family serine protease
MTGPAAAESAPPVPTCYRHPGRETYVRCQRCGRYICPDCMREASVGFQCPSCVAEAAKELPRARTTFGGALTSSGNLVTKVLIGINVAVFMVIQLTGALGSPVLQRLAMVGETSVPSGGGLREGVAEGAVWRLLTSVFVHVQPLHLLFNMVALWIFGPMLESLLGRVRFTGLYLMCGLAGSVLVYLLASPASYTVGASGAVFGLLGAALVISLRRGYDIRWLLGLLAINAVFSLLGPGISWQGHLGGFLAGLLLGGAIAYAPRSRRTLVQWTSFAVVLIACIVLTAVRTAALTS